MMTRAKPLIFAVAMALGASVPAFAQSSGSAASDNGGSTNTKTSPVVTAPAPSSTPVYSADHAPVVSGGASTSVGTTTSVDASAALPADDDAHERAARQARSTSEEEHGGLRNRIHDKKDQAREKLGMGPDDSGKPAVSSDDARERAARQSGATSDEEHGGLRNRMHDKKDRARAKLGMQPDND